MSTPLNDPVESDFPRGWYPVAIDETDQGLQICWQFLGKRRFATPFFANTIASIPKEARLTCRTSREALTCSSADDCLEPTAFIFHASRSGSTLVAQMLAALSQCIVISEPPVMNAALKLCLREATREEGLEILKGVVRALGQRRNDDERYLFIKLDSWHISHLPLIRQVFPATPCFFLYRQPVEILASHRKVRGSQMVPGLVDLAMLGLDSQSTDPADLDGYCLRALGSFFKSAQLHARASNLRLINYKQLPAVIWTHFLPCLSIPLRSADLQLIKHRSLHHSKRPRELFVTDARPDGDEAMGAALELVNAAYEELDRLRSRWQSSSMETREGPVFPHD